METGGFRIEYFGVYVEIIFYFIKNKECMSNECVRLETEAPLTVRIMLVYL